MNIKNLRKNYGNLTKLERLSLADNAIANDDESEIDAIISASPRENFSQVDYYDYLKDITHYRLCNLIVRLNYVMLFDYFYQCGLEKLKNKSVSNAERYFDDARMSAFLYCRAKDSWQEVNDELGLRPNFDKEISEFLFAYDLLIEKEIVMREMAFSLDEAKEMMKRKTGNNYVKTIEEEKQDIRKALELPET